MNVILRHCPECGGPLQGRRGLSWMVCGECALAVDPFVSPADKIVTYRPASDADGAALRLAFYVFDVGEPIRSVWIPAFRSSGQDAHQAGAMLTKEKYRPTLSVAPLGADLARTPAEAVALFRLQRSSGNGGDAEPPTPCLVSLPFQLAKGRLVGPSGTSLEPPGARGPVQNPS